jgi:hypothetical protein
MVPVTDRSGGVNDSHYLHRTPRRAYFHVSNQYFTNKVFRHCFFVVLLVVFFFFKDERLLIQYKLDLPSLQITLHILLAQG